MSEAAKVTPRRPVSPRLEFVVTKEVIETSKTQSSSHCMIAEAIRAAYPGAQQISVDLQTIRFSDPVKRLRYVYLTPRTAQVPIVYFDQGYTPDEFPVVLKAAQVVRMRQQIITPAGTKKQKSNYDPPIVRKASVHQPEVTGGKTPPIGPFAKKRAFGLKALQVPKLAETAAVG